MVVLLLVNGWWTDVNLWSRIEARRVESIFMVCALMIFSFGADMPR